MTLTCVVLVDSFSWRLRRARKNRATAIAIKQHSTANTTPTTSPAFKGSLELLLLEAAEIDSALVPPSPPEAPSGSLVADVTGVLVANVNVIAVIVVVVTLSIGVAVPCAGVGRGVGAGVGAGVGEGVGRGVGGGVGRGVGDGVRCGVGDGVGDGGGV